MFAVARQTRSQIDTSLFGLVGPGTDDQSAVPSVLDNRTVPVGFPLSCLLPIHRRSVWHHRFSFSTPSLSLRQLCLLMQNIILKSMTNSITDYITLSNYQSTESNILNNYYTVCSYSVSIVGTNRLNSLSFRYPSTRISSPHLLSNLNPVLILITTYQHKLVSNQSITGATSSLPRTPTINAVTSASQRRQRRSSLALVVGAVPSPPSPSLALCSCRPNRLKC